MKKTMFFLMLWSGLMTGIYIVDAATLSWDAPITFTDGTPIPAYDIGLITYQTFTGPTSTGPWQSDVITVAGLTTAAVSEPPQVGVLQWYTVEASLNGNTSDKAVPVSLMRPFPPNRIPPAAPSGLRIA